MASGILGAADIAANTGTTIYTVPAAKVATANINICNRNTNSVKIRIALASTGTPSAAEYIEYDTTLAGNGVLERTAFVLNSGKNVVVYSDTANVSAIVHGFEE